MEQERDNGKIRIPFIILSNQINHYIFTNDIHTQIHSKYCINNNYSVTSKYCKVSQPNNQICYYSCTPPFTNLASSTPTGSSRPLLGRSPTDHLSDERFNAQIGVEGAQFAESAIDDKRNRRDRNRCFGYIGCHDDFTYSTRRPFKYLSIKVS